MLLSLIFLATSHLCQAVLYKNDTALVGDILMFKNRQQPEVELWTQGVLLYRFHKNYPEDQKDTVRRAIKKFPNFSCLFPVEIENTHGNIVNPFVEVVDDGGCYSSVGMCSFCSTGQALSLSKGCMYEAAIQHEFMHAAGLNHEQSRPDRDQYINIYYDNMYDDVKAQFNKASAVVKEQAPPSPYDYYSIMHYEFDNGRIDPNKPMMTAKDPRYKDIGTKNKLTEMDKQKLLSMYPCYK